MGCISSKNLRIREEYEEWNTPFLRSVRFPVWHRRWKRKESQHLVTLTSTTYGVLRFLDVPDQHSSAEAMPAQAVEESYESLWSFSVQSRKAPKSHPKACPFPEIRCAIEEHDACKQEIINTAELLAELEEDISPLFSSIAWYKAKIYTRSFSLSSIQAIHSLDTALRRHSKPSAVLTKYHSCISKPKTSCLHECVRENSKPWDEVAPTDQCFGCSCKRSSSKKKSKRAATSPCTPPASSLVQKFELCGASIPSKEKTSKIDKESSHFMPLMSIENTICNHTTPLSNKCTPKKTAKKKRLTPEKSGCYGENLNPQLTLSKSFHTLSGDQLEKIKSPLFDPELLENFERAIEQIGSDEKWLSSTLVSNSVSPTSWSHEDEAATQRGKYLDLFVGRSASNSDNVFTDLLAAGNELESFDFWELDLTINHFMEDARENYHHQGVDELQSFPWMCPPAGEQSVVLYSTSLHGIRKTYEDCTSLQAILRGFEVHVDERDVSMHSGFLQELKELMRERSVTIPRLFIKGHYIGGVEEARLLHEDGKLAKMLDGIRKEDSSSICDGCGGMRFIPCLDCSGSCKIVTDQKEAVRCPDCNENGLIRCPICC